jgi:tetratricopeptide (TPR) repeat protein
MRTLFSTFRKILLAAGVGAATITIYWQVGTFDFILFDDYGYITSNYFIQPGITWENVRWAFTTGYVANWHPITWISHMLDYQWFGLDPGGHHLHSAVLHALTAVLLFLVMRRMTHQDFPSAFVALVFALHPLHVESVAWVSERKDVLSAFFWVLTMGAYAWYTERPNQRRYLFVLVAYAFGLLSKPMVVTLPFVLLLLDFWPLNRIATPFNWHSVRLLVLEKVPMILLAIASSIITLNVQHAAGAVSTLAKLTLGVRVSNALLAYAKYLLKTFWPADLAVFYPHSGGEISLLQVAGSGILVCAITVLCFHYRTLKRYPFLAVGWLWFVGTLVPVIGLVQVGAQAMADRYTYLPMIGIAIAVGWLTLDLSRQRPALKYVTGLLFVGTSVGMAMVTNTQLKHWKDGESLFSHALRVTSDNWMAHYNLGAIYENRGELEKALYHFSKTVEIYPGVASAFYDLGKTQLRLGELGGAIDNLQRSLRMDSTIERAHLHLGEAYARRGELDSALRHFEKAFQFNRHYGEAHHNLALTLAGLGEFAKAIEYLHLGLEKMPGDSVMIADLHRIKRMAQREDRGRR